MTTTSKKAATAGLTVGLIGGAAAGMIFGVPGLTSAEAPSAIVQPVDDGADTAESTDDREELARERLRETLQPLVDDTTINAGQADAVTDHLIENRPDKGMEGGRGHHGRKGGPGGFLGGEVVAETLGMEAEEIRDQLREGATLAELATANDVDPQTLIAALVTEGQARLDEAVADGKIDADAAAEKAAEMNEHITDLVNGEGRMGRGSPAAETSDD